jgi:tetratricopeptide (TPR) repeat protein
LVDFENGQSVEGNLTKGTITMALRRASKRLFEKWFSRVGPAAALLLVYAVVWNVTVPTLTFSGIEYGATALAKKKEKYTVSESEAHFKVGMAAFNKGDMDGAIDALVQATYFARNNYYPVAHHFLGMAYMAKNEDKKAIESLERAIEQAVDEDTLGYFAVAEILARNERYDEANKVLDKIQRHDQWVRTYKMYTWGIIADRQGRYGQAESHYAQAMGKKPWVWTECWMRLAEAKMKNKKFAPAIQEFAAIEKSALILKGLKKDRLYQDIGICRMAIGDHQGAIDNWRKSLEANEENAEVWLQLGLLLDSEKHYSAAAKHYRQFLRYGLASDPRTQSLRDRITAIEQATKENEAIPLKVAPSQYMRNELDQRQAEQQELIQRQQEMTAPKSKDESGF